MSKVILFFLLSLPVAVISRNSLLRFRTHGFYRFLGWECILWLFASNVDYWYADPFSFRQIVSWLLLILSIYYVAAGFVLLKRAGQSHSSPDRPSLFLFEKTTRLVRIGIYSLIRHPMYGSLLLLAWGIYLKNPALPLLATVLACTLFFYLTALCDEKECLAYFGERYRDYMRHTKRFIPYLF